jgi:hypothetical protein
VAVRATQPGCSRLAWLLLIAFVPVWYELMQEIAGHTPLTFGLYATGRVLTVDGGHLTLITAGLSAVTMIVGWPGPPPSPPSAWSSSWHGPAPGPTAAADQPVGDLARLGGSCVSRRGPRVPAGGICDAEIPEAPFACLPPG